MWTFLGTGDKSNRPIKQTHQGHRLKKRKETNVINLKHSLQLFVKKTSGVVFGTFVANHFLLKKKMHAVKRRDTQQLPPLRPSGNLKMSEKATVPPSEKGAHTGLSN